MSGLGLFAKVKQQQKQAQVQSSPRSDYENPVPVKSNPKNQEQKQVESKTKEPSKKEQEKKKEENNAQLKNGNHKQAPEPVEKDLDESEYYAVEEEQKENDDEHDEQEQNEDEDAEEQQDPEDAEQPENSEEQEEHEEEEGEGEANEDASEFADPMDRSAEGADNSGSIKDAKKAVKQTVKREVEMLDVEESSVKYMNVMDTDGPDARTILKIRYFLQSGTAYYVVQDVYKDTSTYIGWQSALTNRCKKAGVPQKKVRLSDGIAPCATAETILDMLEKSLKMDDDRKTQIVKAFVKKHPEHAHFLTALESRITKSKKKRKSILAKDMYVQNGGSPVKSSQKDEPVHKKKKSEQGNTKRASTGLTENDRIALKAALATLKSIDETLKKFTSSVESITSEAVCASRVIISLSDSM
jgi:hypothetical protein